MKKQLLLFFITILSFCYNYSQTLDVDFTGTCGSGFTLNENQTIAQSFTAGLTGNLVQVNAGLSVRACTETSIMNLIAKIYDGTCAATVIATQSFSLPADTFSAVSMREIVFDTPASIVSGQTYTLELSVPSGQACSNDPFFGIEYVNATWHVENGANCGGSYAGGTFFESGCSPFGVDGYIQTFVAPPENSLNFDGNNDVVTFGTSLTNYMQGKTSITVEAKVRPESASGLGMVLGNYDYPNNASSMQFMIRRDGSTYNFFVHNGANLFVVGATNAVNVGVWQHVAGVWDGTNIHIYIDGALINTVPVAANTGFPARSNQFVLGWNANNEGFDGNIDDVRIWEVARTQSEINANKNIELNGNETGLIRYYNLNEGIPGGNNAGETTANDATTNSNSGTLLNFTLTGNSSNWVDGSIDTTSPTVTSVTVPANATYVASQNLDFTVNFDENVTVNTTGGIPQIAITIDSTTRQASYISGSGSTSLLFRYMVQCDEGDTDGIAIGALSLNGGTLQDDSGNDADLTLNSVGNTSSVLVNGSITGTAIANSNVSCNGGSDGSATASATGGTTPYTYLWSNSATTATTTGLTAGTYNVTITDANGCEYTASVTITEPVALVASATANSNVSCNGGSDGSATASATGGTAPYTYLWSNLATTASITGVTAGTYDVTITDANGCTDTASVTITEPVTLVASAIANSNISCNGGSDGSATASVTGGTAPYTYLWSNTATTASITGVSAGTYDVTITDANGCTDTASVTITEPVALVASAIANSNVSCNGGSDGSAMASATGGTAPYTYLWSNSATTASITGVTAGTYDVTITDANGCTDTASVTITEPVALVASAIANSNVSCNGRSDGSATASATGGTAPYTYFWSNTATTASITGVTAGTYDVTITDANGCTDTASVTITEPVTLVATAIANSNISCNGGSDGSATASVTGGTAPYTYLWSNTATTASITGVSAGTYDVTITDANGCTDTASVTITEPVAIDTSVTTDNSPTFTANASGATYQWINCDIDQPIIGETGQSFSATENGSYAVDITINGCTERSACIEVNSLSISDNSNDPTFSIYPNPTSDLITITVPVNKVVIYNLAGKKVKEEISRTFSVKELPAGVYFLNIESEEGIAIRKLVKH